VQVIVEGDVAKNASVGASLLKKMRACEFCDTAFSTVTFNSCECNVHTGMIV
jgi:hypothetical protein